MWARGDLRIPAEDEPEPEPEQQLDRAFAAFGLRPEEPVVVEEEFFLWPENVRAFNLWLAVQTQWQWRPSGPFGLRRSGLNYPGVQVCINNMGLPKKERPWYFGAVQAMENAALNEWNKER
jgi:hypothetical protein